MNKLNLLGRTFGRLTVFAEASRQGVRVRWQCRCVCGTEKAILAGHLHAGRILSCGCLQREKAGKKPTHGGSRTRLYGMWNAMKSRCNSPTHRFWHDYGGRGIKVCPAWDQDFVTFRDWALSHGYKKGLVLDRRDNDGDYEPGNCRFVTWKESNRNTRSNLLITAFGETKCAAAWAEDPRCVVCKSVLSSRIREQGLAPESAITKPSRIPKKG